MKYLFDIGHPAHVHYFKNLMWALQDNGREINVTARNKELTLYLLDKYGFEYVCTSKNRPSILGKGISLIKNDFIIYKEVKKNNPDILISFFLPFSSHVGKILNKPVLGFTDTEHAKLNRFLSERFTNTIVTPSCFKSSFPENKHIKFDGYFELAYLHPNYFRPDPSILNLLGVKNDEKYVIMRFVSWTASHDIGHSGLSLEMKKKAVKALSKYAKVFISSEGELPEDLIQYRIKIPPEKMHDALYYATMYFGDGGTMASESAVLGTVAINVATSAVSIGTFADIAKYDLMYIIPDEQEAFKKAVELLKDYNLKTKALDKRKELIASKIDVTAFMMWFVENYPASVNTINLNPDYQYKFK